MGNYLSAFDIKIHLKQNKGLYFCFVFSMLVGLVVGFVIVASNDSYLALLTSDNKVLYSIINGTAKSAELFWRKFLNFIIPLALIFLLSLNHYAGYLSMVLVGYQSSLFVMSSCSIISVYGVSGVLNFLFLSLPINVLYLLTLIFYSVVCLKRSKQAATRKSICFGMSDHLFLLQVVICFLIVSGLVFVGTIIFPLFIKNAIFIIF